MSKQATNEAGVKVGDLFVSSWGYDQTNVDFYKVVGVTAKGVRVQQWQASMVDSHGPAGDRLVAGDGPKVGSWVPTEYGSTYDPHAEAPVRFKKLQTWTDPSGVRQVAFSVASYANAYLWDGQPQYATGAGYGH